MPFGHPGGLIQRLMDPDKDKRDQLIALIMQDPSRIQALSDNIQNPNQLGAITGQNPRFGGNHDNQDLQSMIANTPQSTPVRLNNLQQFQDSGFGQVANASVSSPTGMAAFRGMTPEQVRDTVQNAPIDSSGKKQFLSQDDKDILAKKNGLETSDEKHTRFLQNAETLQRSSSMQASDARAAQLLPLEVQGKQQDIAKNEQMTAADRAVDGWFVHDPKQRARKLTDIWSDNKVPADVRAAIPFSPKYKESFEAQFRKDAEDARLAVEKERIDGENKSRDEWLPKLITAKAAEAYANYGFSGSIKGFKDLMTGDQSPEADQAREIAAHGTPKMKIAQVNSYNSNLIKLQGLIKTDKNGKTPDPTQVQSLVDVLNTDAGLLTAAGIPKQQLKYDFVPDSEKSIGQNISGTFTPKAKLPKAIMHLDGTPVTPAAYDPSKDPANAQSTVESDNDLNIKANLYSDIKKQNPTLPETAVRARVEAEFKKRKGIK